MQFCAEDPVRHQLLIQRPIPGFVPSPESYRLAAESLDLKRAAVHDCGVSSPRGFDMFTAPMAGWPRSRTPMTPAEPAGCAWPRPSRCFWITTGHLPGQRSDLLLTAEHDGRIVANVVADWAPRHGQPFVLELTGPAGGIYAAGSDGVRLQMDAIEFCRTLSGRETDTGILTTPITF